MAPADQGTIESSGFSVEFRGDLSQADLERVLDQLQLDDGITRIRLEIELEQRMEALPIGSSGGLERESVPASDDEPGSESTDEASEDAEPAEPSIPSLRPGGDPLKLLRVLHDRDEWLLTDEIIDAIPEDWDVNTDNVSAGLWNLADRGLLEKRKFEGDRRKSEYRISDTGRQAIDRVDEAELDELPTDGTEESTADEAPA